MKIAVIAKAEIGNPKTYTAHKNKVVYHPEDLFLGQEDKNALEYAVQLVEVKGGTIDAYTFEQGAIADRVLHEALALGATSATKITGGDINDPQQQPALIQKFAHYLNEQGLKYDLLLTSCTPFAEFAAQLAVQLDMSYYDHVSMIDTAFNFEMKLAKGKIAGRCNLPAVITTTSAINVPRLADFTALSTAINSSVTAVTFDQQDVSASEVRVANAEKTKVLFNLEQDPQATQKLVDALKQNGILR